MDLTKFKKIVNTVVGVLLLLPNVLAVLGVIPQDAVASLVDSITALGAGVIAVASAIGGIILVFTGGEPLSLKNVL